MHCLSLNIIFTSFSFHFIIFSIDIFWICCTWKHLMYTWLTWLHFGYLLWRSLHVMISVPQLVSQVWTSLLSDIKQYRFQLQQPRLDWTNKDWGETFFWWKQLWVRLDPSKIISWRYTVTVDGSTVNFVHAYTLSTINVTWWWSYTI